MIDYRIKLVPEQVDAIFEQEFKDTILYNLEEIASLENEESLKPYKVRDLVDMREYIEAAKKVWSWHTIEPFPMLMVLKKECEYCGKFHGCLCDATGWMPVDDFE